MQHQPLELELAHVLELDALARVQVRQRAEHPAQRVAQLAVGVDEGVEDLRADAQVVGVVGRRHPQAQDVGAGLLHHVLRRHDVADRLRHLLPLLVEDEAVGQHDVVGRAGARAAGFQQRGLEPAAMLVGAFEIHDAVLAAVAHALDAGERREVLRILQREGMRRAAVEPHVENVAHLLPLRRIVDEAVEEALLGALVEPHVGAAFGERLRDAAPSAPSTWRTWPRG